MPWTARCLGTGSLRRARSWRAEAWAWNRSGSMAVRGPRALQGALPPRHIVALRARAPRPPRGPPRPWRHGRRGGLLKRLAPCRSAADNRTRRRPRPPPQRRRGRLFSSHPRPAPAPARRALPRARPPRAVAVPVGARRQTGARCPWRKLPTAAARSLRPRGDGRAAARSGRAQGRERRGPRRPPRRPSRRRLKRQRRPPGTLPQQHTPRRRRSPACPFGARTMTRRPPPGATMARAPRALRVAPPPPAGASAAGPARGRDGRRPRAAGRRPCGRRPRASAGAQSWMRGARSCR